MHPSPSLIIFTSLSGFGFGLLIFLGLGIPDVHGWDAFVFFTLAVSLCLIGLCASIFHLGNPKNILKSFSQWQSSWLSREAILSMVTLYLMSIYEGLSIFFDIKIIILGWIGAGLSLLTVFSTAMIYAQLKTVPRWNHWLTPVLFIFYSISSGALLSGALSVAFGAIFILLITQIAYWYFGDKAFIASGSNLATATGLNKMGNLRQFEPPHTGDNFLLKEMVYIIGRKHALKLRILGTVAFAGIPLLILASMFFSYIMMAIIIASHIIGTIICRWLFFAEAEHVVGIYYDKR